MGGTQNKAHHPYMRKVNWEYGGTCNFWWNSSMYSKESKRIFDQDVRELETTSLGVIKTINKEL